MAKPTKLKSGNWLIRWFDADGERQCKTLATYDLARAELRRLEVEADQTKIRRERLGAGVFTVTEAGERFLANRRREPDETERRFKARGNEHQRHFDRHIKPHVGDVKLCDLTPPVLRRFLDVLKATKTNRHGEVNAEGRTLSASAIRNIVVTLRQIAKANDVELVVHLAESLKQKRRKSRPRALQSIEDVRTLLAACRDPWFRVAAAIACYCGARLGEVASLRWRHIGAQTVTIALSWEGPLKARYEDDEEAARTVPLDPDLAALLEDWRKVTGGRPDDRIVLVGGARPLREGFDDVAQKTRSACKRAGLREHTFHQLRHTFGTIVASNGLPLSQLQALMGHADLRTTSIYVNAESELAAKNPLARLSAADSVN